MCGIAGILSLNERPLSEDSERAALRMRSALAHRGPDDEGAWTDPDRRVIFAHKRLSIIDPTPEGHQPMISIAGSALVFNGEIYNYKELRSEYDLDISTASDTAVLLALLEKFGAAILSKLCGFFAFAWYDPLTRSLLMARDAIGKKPLYYAHTHNKLLFASETRALLATGFVDRSISRDALAEYLTHYAVPHPHSLISGVHALEPGQMLRLDANGHVKLERWYRLPTYSSNGANYKDAVEETRRLLERSIRYRLVSDVPVGAFLSGGLDSNAVVALMSCATSRPVNTFTIGFNEGEGELEFARTGAKHYGANHHEQIVRARDVFNALPEYFWRMDAPTGDGLNTFLVSKATRTLDPTLKVVLSGVGGDEVFLGYKKYRWLAKRRGLLRALWATPRALRASLAKTMGSTGSLRILNGIRSVLDPLHSRVLFDESEIERLVGGTGWAVRNEYSSMPESIESLLRTDLEWYLPDTLLRDLDVMSMSQGLEARAPLLDRDLIEFGWQLPIEVKSRGNSKQILADAVRDLLPTELLTKPKTGFELPMKQWLLHGELRPLLDLLKAGKLATIEAGLLNKSAVEEIYRRFVSGSSHYLKPWTLLALEFWYRSFEFNASYEDWCSGAWKDL